MSAPPLHIHALIDSLYVGGAENLLCDFVAGAEQRGVRTTVSYLSVAQDLGAPRLRALGVEPRPLDVRHLLSPTARRLVADDLAELRPDVLHTHLSSSDFLGSLAGRRLGVPVVSTLHSAGPQNGRRRRLRQRLAAAARRRGASRVIAVSDAARRYHAELGWDDPERLLTVRNGIRAEARAGVGPRIRECLGIAADELVLATVSVLKEGKGHEIAIELTAALRERGVPAHLLVLGDGPLRAEIERSLERLGGHAQALGHRDDVADVLDAVDVLVHPSSADAFPGAVLEAMAASVPVLASDVGGIPEIVVDGGTGLLVAAPPAAATMIEPLARLAGDPELRRRLGRAGRERLDAEFTVERWMDRLLPVYESVIAENAETCTSTR